MHHSYHFHVYFFSIPCYLCIWTLFDCTQLFSTEPPCWHWLRLPYNVCCICSASMNTNWYAWCNEWEAFKEKLGRSNLWRYQRWIKEVRKQVFISCSQGFVLSYSPQLLQSLLTACIVGNQRLCSLWLSSTCVCLFSVVVYTGNVSLLIKSWRVRMRRLHRPTVSGYCKLNFDV